GFVVGFGVGGRGDFWEDEDAVAECGALVGLQGEVQGWSFVVGEDFGGKRVGGKQAVAARVPVSGVTGIFRMIEDGDGDGIVAYFGGENAPAAASSPRSIAGFAIAGHIVAVDPGVIHFSDGRGAAAGVGEDFGFVGRHFERAGYTHTEETFLIVGEDHFLGLRLQRGDAIDAAEFGIAAEDEAGAFLQDELLLAGDPVRVDYEFATVGTAGGGDDRAMEDAAHFGGVFGLDGGGIVPEVEAINV